MHIIKLIQDNVCGIILYKNNAGNNCYFLDPSKETVCPFSRLQVPDSFLSQHIAICQQFTEFQEETIQNNLDHFPNMSEEYRMWVESMKDYCSDFFMTKYDLEELPGHLRIVPFKAKVCIFIYVIFVIYCIQL